ncbi:MAG: amidohydrolase family protein, partial [Limisphaerales bacterium]
HFGPDRLMYGSDWPVCLLSAEYQAVHALIMNHIASFTVEEQDAIMGTNAIRFYDLKVAAPSHPSQQA